MSEHLQQIVARFQKARTSRQKYELLLAYANRLPPFPEEKRTEANLVRGCASRVWLAIDFQDGKIFIQGDADAQLVKGLVAVLVEGLSGLSAEEILQISPDFINEMGINFSLSPSRSNGFFSMYSLLQQRTLDFQLSSSADCSVVL
ncbi:MAG: SufE family protein [Cyanobacteriota bacterium]